MTLEKATLQEIGTQPTPRPVPVPGTLITVQVNPTSLRLALTNNTDVGKSVGRPNTTFQGSSSSTLSFDLMMDTADQGTTGEPVDVQTLTAQLERFMLPKTGEPKGVPPRVLFSYGSLQVAGVMSALNLEYDLFSSTGKPLRAKASVTIKEQLPQLDADLLGAGANTGSAATPAVPPAQGAGAPAASPPADRTGTALGGESAADFATRMGLDPSTWKTFAAGISDPLSLDAGLQIDFSSSASASAGLGIQSGATATGTGADPADATTPVDSLSPAALTAAGGVSAAIAQQALSQSAAVAATAAAAFAPGAATAAGTTAGAAGTTAGAAGTTAGGAATAAAAAGAGTGASPVPQFSPDPRATSFGFGVPLRPLIPLPNRAAVALVHDVPRGQTWPPAGTLGGPAAPATGTTAGPGSASGACGCGCGGGS